VPQQSVPVEGPLASRTRRASLRVLAAGIAGLAAAGARAQDAPVPKAIRMVVPFAPGASNDLFARALAQRLGPRIGATIVVENKPGAGGVIGASDVVRAAADGSSLLFTSSAITTNAAIQRNLPYDPVNDFAPVALVARSGLILLVNNETPFTTVPQLLQAMRDPANRISYGSSGVGSVNHVATELLHSMAGTSAQHVAYKGISAVMVDLLGGRLEVLLSTVASAKTQIQTGKVRALAVSSPQRTRFHPDLPPIADFVPGYSAEVWWGVFAPGKTPRPLVDRLNAEIRAVTAQPDMQELFAGEAAEASPLTAAQFATRYTDEIAIWKKVAAERKITAD
jgi:tripartite-type tricarboxylate transporter receptor subunit TctC